MPRKTWIAMILSVLACVCLPAVAPGADDDSEPGVSGSVTMGGRYTTVHGDEDKFREDNWIWDGGGAGIRQFELIVPGDGWNLDISGKAFHPGDYGTLMELTKPGHGFVKFEFEQFDTYDDSSNLFYGFPPNKTDRGRELVKAWRDASLTLGWTPPESPDFALTLNRWEKFGERSLLRGGAVTDGTNEFSRFPQFEELDEGRDRIGLEMTHRVGSFDVRLGQRYENFDGHNEVTEFVFDDTGSLDEFRLQDFEPDRRTLLTDFQVAGDLLPRKLRLEVVAQYADVETDTTYDENAFDGATGAPSAREHFNWNFVDNSHDGEARRTMFDARLIFTPDHIWTFFGGAGYKLDDDNHHSVENIDAPHRSQFFPGDNPAWPWDPDGVVSRRLVYDTDHRRETYMYNAGARVRPVRWLVGQVETRLERGTKEFDWTGMEPIDFDVAGDNSLRWVSDNDFDRDEYSASVTVKPTRYLKLIGKYDHTAMDNDYHDKIDMIDGASAEDAFPGFMDDHNRLIQEWAGIVQYSPSSRLWGGYKLKSRTQDIRIQDQPGEKMGESDSLIHSLNVSLVPVEDLVLSLFTSYRKYELKTAARDAPAFFVGGYSGDATGGGIEATYTLNEATELTAGASRTGADNGDRNHHFGGFHMGFKRRLNETWSLSGGYNFSYFDEEDNGNIDDYQAHTFNVGLTGTFNGNGVAW